MSLKIDGLIMKERVRGAEHGIVFTSETGPKSRAIEVCYTQENLVRIRFLQDGRAEDAGPEAEVYIPTNNPILTERFVRVLAHIFLDIPEPKGGFARMDAFFLKGGFQIALNEAGQACWMRPEPMGCSIISRKYGGGLPLTADDIMEFLFVGAHGRKVVADIVGMDVMQQALSDALLQKNLDPHRDRLLGTIFSREDKTFH